MHGNLIAAAGVVGWTRRIEPRESPRGRLRAGLLVSAITALLVVGASHSRAYGQAQPHLTGSIELDLSTGRLRGNVCLARVPVDGDRATVILNEALSIEALSGAELPGMIEQEPGGGTVRHTFTGVHSRLTADHERPVTDLCVRYSGTQPVYRIADGEYRSEDASNVIAFNGRSVRARGAARWYPTAYDAVTGTAVEALTFEIHLRCEACRQLYVNGGEVTSGPEARFESPVPRELMVIAGDLPVSEVAAGRVIGELVPSDTAANFFRTLAHFRSFLQEFVGVPYGDPPDIIRVDPVQRPRRGQLWGYFSDPALTLIGMSVGDFVKVLQGPPTPARRSIIGFLNHELAHRYFGWSLGAASAQRDLFGEPFATYLEFKAVRHFVGEDEYEDSLQRLRQRVAGMVDPTPLAEAAAEDFADPAYRYAYAPLMLFALEDEVGEQAMRRLLTSLITASGSERRQADLRLLARKATEAGISETALRRWEQVCLQSPPSENTCIKSGAKADPDHRPSLRTSASTTSAP